MREEIAEFVAEHITNMCQKTKCKLEVIDDEICIVPYDDPHYEIDIDDDNNYFLSFEG